MPLVKRLVEPVYVSRGLIPKGVKNELEAVAVNTLSGVILQLSSLAKHSESIFAELYNAANGIYQRTCSAQERINALAKKITKLDSAGEEISLQDINLQKAFKSTIHSDQQVVSRETMPEAMIESYSRCEPVPALSMLTKYRQDGKDALKFYTDPSYFFELWKEEMSAELEKRKKRKKRGGQRKKREEEKKVVKGVKKKEVEKNIPDWEIQANRGKRADSFPLPPMDEPPALSPTHSISMSDSPTRTPTPDQQHSPRRQSTKRAYSNASLIGKPTAAPPPPPPPLHPGPNSPARMYSPPPPPPPPLDGPVGVPPSFPPPPPPNSNFRTSQVPPPPPPIVPAPPPPPVMGPPPPPPPPLGQAPALSRVASSPSGVPPPPSAPAPPPPEEAEPDSRNDLLSAIRMGMALRKTQANMEEKKEQKPMANDVASILARRIAIEVSDSEGEYDDDEGDSDEWSDDD